MTNYYKQEEILKGRNEFLVRIMDNLELPVVRLSCPGLKAIEINQKAFDIIKNITNEVESNNIMKKTLESQEEFLDTLIQ